MCGLFGKVLRCFALPICLLVWILPLKAAEIEITGNKRTKERYLQKLATGCIASRDQKEINKDPDPTFRTAEAIRQLRQCLLHKADFLEDLLVTRYDEQKITIVVKEKWTFLILPSYVQSEEAADNKIGLLLYETNLGGVGNEIGVLYNRGLDSNLNTYATFFRIPYIDAAGKFDLDFILWNRDARIYNYDKERWIFRTREIFRFFWLRLKHHINDQLSLSYGYAPASLRFSDGEFSNGTKIESTPAVNSQNFNLALEWEDTEFKYYYEAGSQLLLTWHQQAWRDDSDPLESALLFELTSTHPTYKKHFLQVSAGAGARSHVNIDDHLRVGNDIGSRGIPSDGAWGKAYATLGLDYQMPITSGRYGYWTAGPFVDAGHLWETPHIPTSELTYAAVGIASYVRLLKVNVPAIGVFYSHNNRYKSDFFSFYVGFTF